MVDREFERSQEKHEPNHARPLGDCPVTWGTCGGDKPVYWGKPSDTPHRCSGPATHIRRALVKYHICESCNMIGGHVMPSPYSKAGAQMRAVFMNRGNSK